MSLKNVDFGAMFGRIADRKIEEAMQEGKFDNLPGAGKPLDLEPMPATEKARLTWWALRLLKQNEFTPDEIVWRKQIDRLKEQLDTATTDAQVVALVGAINKLVLRLNTLGTNALPLPNVAVSLDAERQKLRERTG